MRREHGAQSRHAARPECGLDRRSQAFDPAAACRRQSRSHAVIADRLDDGTIGGRFATARRSASEAAPRRPQQESQARRSAAARARAPATAGRASQPVVQASRSTAEKSMPAARSAGSSVCAWLRARTSTAILVSPAARASRILATTVPLRPPAAARDRASGATSRRSKRRRTRAKTPLRRAWHRTRRQHVREYVVDPVDDRALRPEVARAARATPTGTLATDRRACASMNSERPRGGNGRSTASDRRRGTACDRRRVPSLRSAARSARVARATCPGTRRRAGADSR